MKTSLVQFAIKQLILGIRLPDPSLKSHQQKQQCQQSIQNTSPSIQKTLMTTLSVFQILFGLITSFTQLLLMYSGISLPYTNFNHNNFGMYCLISSMIGSDEARPGSKSWVSARIRVSSFIFLVIIMRSS